MTLSAAPSSSSIGRSVASQLPDRVGQFLVHSRLGQGAFAEVYLCKAENGASVAVKVLRQDLEPSIARQVRARFLMEERIANSIGDPRVVKVFATSAPGDEPCFIAMEYVDGENFCDSFRKLRGRRSSACETHLCELARLGHEVAQAMTAAHARGIVHRDLKPDNVLVTHSSDCTLPTVKIVDYGIAKAPTELLTGMPLATLTPHHTELGTVMGSPPYMAPEQNGAAHAVTGKADVYALGVMLAITALGLDHEALELNRASFVVPEQVERLFSLGAPLPEAWQRLLRRMIAPAAEDRPEMRDVAVELGRLAQPNQLFAESVHAWLTRNRLPKPRVVAELLRESQVLSYLSDHERAFLREVPARILERSRSFLGRLLLVALAAGTASLGYAWARDHERLAYLQTRTHVERGERQRIAAELEQRRAAQALPAVAQPANAAPRTDSAAKVSDGARSDTLKGEDRLACRAVSAELAECTRQRDTAKDKTALVELKLETMGRDLELRKRESQESSESEARCRRELEARSGELAECSNRVRLCSQSLRGRVSTGLERLDPGGEPITDP